MSVSLLGSGPKKVVVFFAPLLFVQVTILIWNLWDLGSGLLSESFGL